MLDEQKQTPWAHTVLVVELLNSVEYKAYSRKNAEIVLDPCVGQRSNLFFEDQ